ncbi:MAG TPA: DUF4129 domain-containing protein [Pyrinomonadaceae bacterium]|nr:DUF4129 domain-containing protein [Pyrinomonadaceae bacterium]
MLGFFLFLFPINAFAIPISAYQQNLKNVITALDTLLQSDEEESSEHYESRFEQTIEAIRRVVPEHQTVESEAETYNVDNSWLHKDLNALQESNDRLKKITHILEALRSLEARIAQRQQPANSSGSKDDAKGKLEGILSRPEYATGAKGPNALTRLIQDFLRWLLKLFPQRAPMAQGRANVFTRVAEVLVVLLTLFVLAYAARFLIARFKPSLKRSALKKRQARIVLGERLEPDQTAIDLLSEAEALARSGDLRAAIRKAYIALLVELGDRKLISLAQHKTNRDYLNSVRHVPHLHSCMGGLTNIFERHWYGLAQATPDDWQDFRAGYVAALQTGN